MIIVFDAQCLLCSAWVRFLLKHDRQQRMRFASIQTATGQALLKDAGLSIDHLETLLVVENGRSWQHTAAVFRILHRLGWPWRLAWLGYPIPSPIRDGFYRWIARNRYRFFGHSETCLLPAPEHAHRFL